MSCEYGECQWGSLCPIGLDVFYHASNQLELSTPDMGKSTGTPGMEGQVGVHTNTAQCTDTVAVLQTGDDVMMPWTD